MGEVIEQDFDNNCVAILNSGENSIVEFIIYPDNLSQIVVDVRRLDQKELNMHDIDKLINGVQELRDKMK